jgi:hypothetical protein
MKTKMVRYTIDLANPPALTAAQKAELKALADMPDSEINYSGIPSLTEKFWQNAVRDRPHLRAKPRRHRPRKTKNPR